MKKLTYQIILIISIFLSFNCIRENTLKSKYLDSKNCIYKITSVKDTLFIDYNLIFDTSTFSLANLDTTKFTLYQSSYFAWHNSYISLKVLMEHPSYDFVYVNWKKDSALRQSLYTLRESKSDLIKEFKDNMRYTFISYLIDSIPVEDYFIYNQILSELYNAYKDPRLKWNYVYVVDMYAKNQCGSKDKDVSFEILYLINIGIELSILPEDKKRKLEHYNNFFISHCLPEKEQILEDFNLLKLKFKNK